MAEKKEDKADQERMYRDMLWASSEQRSWEAGLRMTRCPICGMSGLSSNSPMAIGTHSFSMPSVQVECKNCGWTVQLTVKGLYSNPSDLMTDLCLKIGEAKRLHMSYEQTEKLYGQPAPKFRYGGGLEVELNTDYARQTLVDGIKDWFDTNAHEDSKAVIGMSGGKDSLCCAMLCIGALGKDRVVGVTMPMYDSYKGEYIGESPDKGRAQCKMLGIECREVNILPAVQALMPEDATKQARTNLPARIRMSALYAISQSIGGRVICTSNASEDYIGWNTRWGDNVGDLQPLRTMTCIEVIRLLVDMLIDAELTDRSCLPGVPQDGLCGKSDEESFGFTYADLDRYILTEQGEPEVIKKICELRDRNEFKMHMPDYVDLRDV